MVDPFLAAHLTEIRRARERIAPHVRTTPVLETGVGPAVKAECLQLTGSFKSRGAFNAALCLLDRAAAAGVSVPGLAAVSSGNHAQAVARVGRDLGMAVSVVMPEDSAPHKLAATRALGATVVCDGVTVANREERLAELAAATGYAVVHPFDDWDVIHGQGTAALELLEDRPDVATVVVPVGGGGLISGTALALAGLRGREVRVVGAEPEQADDAARSLRTRTHVHRAPGTTLADGARPPAIGRRSFEVIVEHGLVDDIVTVSDEALVDAMRTLWETSRLVVEPTGALAFAAAVAGAGSPGAPAGRPARGGSTRSRTRTVAIVSGANIDPRKWAEVVVHSS